MTLCIAGGSLLATSCQFFKSRADEDEKGEPLARVYDRYLYRNDIEDLVPVGISGKDSAAVLQNYINVWARDQLMIYKAEYNLTESKKNFEKQIQEYRNDLLKFAYREEYVRQNLDTTVSEREIEEYYSSGKSNLMLKEHILRANYMIVNRQAPDLKKALEWFHSTDEDDRGNLEEFALKYAYRFSLQDSNWISFDRIKELVPVKAADAETFLSSNDFVERRDSTNIYLLKIVDYKLKGEQAPLEYSRNVIKNILLNRRKLDLLENLEQSLLTDALDKDEFEVY